MWWDTSQEKTTVNPILSPHLYSTRSTQGRDTTPPFTWTKRQWNDDAYNSGQVSFRPPGWKINFNRKTLIVSYLPCALSPSLFTWQRDLHYSVPYGYFYLVLYLFHVNLLFSLLSSLESWPLTYFLVRQCLVVVVGEIVCGSLVLFAYTVFWNSVFWNEVCIRFFGFIAYSELWDLVYGDEIVYGSLVLFCEIQNFGMKCV